jgi:hypothetical protein
VWCILAAVCALLPSSVAQAEAPTFRGWASQSAHLASTLPSGVSVTGGATTHLNLGFDASTGNASFEATGHVSLLYGNDATTQWLSILADPSAGSALLASPAIDPSKSAPQSLFILALDSASLGWYLGPFDFEAGKSFANWGVGKAFSPADFTAEFDYAGASPSRRAKLLARATWFPGATSRLDLVYDPWAAKGATLAARAYATILDSLAFSLAAGYREASGSSPRRLLGGLELSFDIPFVSPCGEAAFELDLDGSQAFSYSLMAGATAKLGEAALLGEYLFSPDAPEPHSLYCTVAYAFDEWISASLPFLWYPASGAMTTGLTLSAGDLAGLTFSLTATASRSVMDAWSANLGTSARVDF